MHRLSVTIIRGRVMVVTAAAAWEYGATARPRHRGVVAPQKRLKRETPG
jgi:hypothetical protein